MLPGRKLNPCTVLASTRRLQAQQTLQHLSEIKHFPALILVICRLLPQKLLTPRSTPTTDSSLLQLFPSALFLCTQYFITISKPQRKVICWACSSWSLADPDCSQSQILLAEDHAMASTKICSSLSFF